MGVAGKLLEWFMESMKEHKLPPMIYFIVLLFVVSVHIAWAHGMIPSVPGFAKATDVDGKIEQVLTAMDRVSRSADMAVAESRLTRSELIAERVRQTHILMCRADTQTEKDIHYRVLSEMQGRYSRLNQNEQVSLPSCTDLI